VEVKPKAGGVPEKIPFYNVKGPTKQEAINSISNIVMDIAEDIKEFWECVVEVRYVFV